MKLQVKYTNPIQSARTDGWIMMIARSSTKPFHTLNQVEGRESMLLINAHRKHKRPMGAEEWIVLGLSTVGWLRSRKRPQVADRR